jgi:hypothetical protein
MEDQHDQQSPNIFSATACETLTLLLREFGLLLEQEQSDDQCIAKITAQAGGPQQHQGREMLSVVGPLGP